MLIDEVSIHYNATKNRDYRERVLGRFSVLLEFLLDKKWIDPEVQERYLSDPESFELHTEDLIDGGIDFIYSNYDKWLRGLDRSSKSFTVESARSRLEKLSASEK